MITVASTSKINVLKKFQLAYQATIQPKAPFKRLIQNQIPGSYRYEAINVFNELVTTIRDENYHKPKHILISGDANLGKTYFLNKLIGNFIFKYDIFL